MKKIAYICRCFPWITETFTLNEILELVSNHNFDIEIYSLITNKERIVHEVANPLLSRTHNAGFFFDARVFFDNLRTLLNHPVKYISTFLKLLLMLFPNVILIAKSVYFFPKSVHFACKMRKSGIRYICCNFASHPATAGWIIKQLEGIPFGFSAHAHDIFVYQHGLKKKMEEAHLIVPISRFNKNFLISHYGSSKISSKMVLVHCGILPQKVTKVQKDAAQKGDDSFIILCVAALKKYKGHKVLVEAIRKINTKIPSLHVQFIGSGPEKRNILKQIEKSNLSHVIELLGDLDNSIVKKYISKCDIFVHPSIRQRDGMMDGIPVAIMESFLYARPVITSKLSGIPELAIDGINSIVVEPGNPEALVDAIMELYHDPQKRKLFGKNGRDKVLSDFLLSKEVRKLAVAINTVLESKG